MVPMVLVLCQYWKRSSERGRSWSENLCAFLCEIEALLGAARSQLAAFVGADADELVFVPNATTGVNTVLRSLLFNPGDELLTTNLKYNACRNALDVIASRTLSCTTHQNNMNI